MVGKITTHTSNVLDLTRAVAAGLVVLFHARVYVLGGALPTGLGGFISYCIANCGTQAVFWFFVISGYLVGGSIIRDVERESFDPSHYLLNRLSRLYIVLLPALLLGGLLDVVRIEALGPNAHAGFETDASLTFGTFLGNALFLQTLLTPTFGSNYALWSLACEFWYYLLFPLLLVPFFANGGKTNRFLIFLIGVSLYLVLTMLNQSLAWLFIIWCMGVVARIIPRRVIKSESLAWMLAIAAIIAFPLIHPHVGPLATVLVAATFAMALNAGYGKGKIWRYESVVKGFGSFSYSLYLVHLPIMHFVLTMARHNADPFLSIQPFSAAAASIIFGLVILCYAAAFLFYLLTERHTQWLRDRVYRLFGKTQVVKA